MDRPSRTSRARSLRVTSTDAERKLRSVVRGRQFEGFKFRRQLPIDRDFADFACIELKLIIELDGGQHADQIACDTKRTRVIEACGWHVIRFWNNDVLQNIDGVAVAIRDQIDAIR